MMAWRPVLEGDERATALATAREVARRLREPEQVEAAVAAALAQTSFPKAVHWEPAGLAQGYAGLALMCAQLDAGFPDEGWDRAGHRYLSLAAQGAERWSYLPTGLWSGLSGLAFAAWSLSRGGTRYGRLLGQIEARLLPQVASLGVSLPHQRQGVSVGSFDIISGLAGAGAYLLCRRDSDQADAALRAALHGLVALSAPVDGLPRWYTPPQLIGDESMLEQCPEGNLNCGLAHGIPGPLALLALARMAGVEVEGMPEAIDRVARWLVAQQMEDAWGVNWPTFVPVESVDGTGVAGRATHTGRAAWCYGSPGLARALWLAGAALDIGEYRELAVAALEAVYRRPLGERRIFSPTFCHGVAGLLQITLRFANDTRRDSFVAAAHTLSRQLLAFYDPGSRLGFYSIEPGGGRVDQPGLLDGVPGVALVLLAAATEQEPSWDRAFLLA